MFTPHISLTVPNYIKNKVIIIIYSDERRIVIKPEFYFRNIEIL